MLPFMARILMAANVVPGPPVEASVLDVGDVLGGKVIADVVALVDGAPDFSRFGIRGDSHAVANAGGEDAASGAVGIELEDVGTLEFSLICIRIVDVGYRANRNVHLLSVFGKSDVARPVPAAAEAAAAGQVGDLLRRASRFEVSILVGNADYRIRVADVDPFRIWSRRVKRNSKRLGQAGGEGLGAFRFAVFRHAAENLDV